MNLKQLEKEYDKLQIKYGDKNLDSIYNGGYMFCVYESDQEKYSFI